MASDDEIITYWKPHIRYTLEDSGILSLFDLISLNSSMVQVLEIRFRLPVTGDINKFLSNYREKYYTKHYLAYWSLEDSLLTAAARGDIEVVNLSLSKGACCIEVAMCEAAKGGHQEIVKLLIQYGLELNLSMDFQSGMACAAEGGHRELVEMFMNSPYNISDFTKAIRYAARGRQLEILELLIRSPN